MAHYRYVHKNTPVEAMQFRGRENCREVFGFLGLKHEDEHLDEADHDLLFAWPEGRAVECGHFIVKYPDGTIRTEEESIFLALHEEVTG
jgi:hypothetical protein